MEEIWKNVIGYNNKYQISNYGNLKSFVRNPHGVLLKFHKTKKGYMMCYLRYKSHGSFMVHRLVALYFLNSDNPEKQVNHKDGNKQNNRVDNLEWMTCKENINHAISTGLRTAKINLVDNRMFDTIQLTGIKEMIIAGISNIDISAKYNCHHSTISKIRRGHNYPNLFI